MTLFEEKKSRGYLKTLLFSRVLKSIVADSAERQSLEIVF